MKRLKFEIGENVRDSGLPYLGDVNCKGNRRIKTRCSCGKEFEILLDSLTKKNPTKSCGCLTSDIIRKKKTKHGKCNTELYSKLVHMKSRCYDPKDKRYDRYGGRGIFICDEWLNDFESFYEWAMSNGYSPDLQIDRINNDDGYYPENCRFVTGQVNSRNKGVRSDNTSGLSGVGVDKRSGKYYAVISLDNKKRKSLGYYHDFFEACCARKGAENRYW